MHVIEEFERSFIGKTLILAERAGNFLKAPLRVSERVAHVLSELRKFIVPAAVTDRSSRVEQIIASPDPELVRFWNHLASGNSVEVFRREAVTHCLSEASVWVELALGYLGRIHELDKKITEEGDTPTQLHAASIEALEALLAKKALVPLQARRDFLRVGVEQKINATKPNSDVDKILLHKSFEDFSVFEARLRAGEITEALDLLATMRTLNFVDVDAFEALMKACCQDSNLRAEANQLEKIIRARTALSTVKDNQECLQEHDRKAYDEALAYLQKKLEKEIDHAAFVALDLNNVRQDIAALRAKAESTDRVYELAEWGLLGN